MKKGDIHINKDDRLIRIQKAGHMRFVEHMTETAICEKMGVNRRTTFRDIACFRARARKYALRNLEHEIRDLAEELKLSYAYKISLLWGEYNRLEKLEDKTESRPARMKIISKITETEEALLEHLRKLGIIKTVVDESKSPINLGVMIGNPGGKGTEELEVELAENLAIIGSAGIAPTNRL